MAVSLQPQVDTETRVSLGASGKSTLDTNSDFYYFNCSLGPNIEYNVKGHRDGSANFTVHSSQLLSRSFPNEECKSRMDNVNPLTQKLGISDWLERSISKSEDPLSSFMNINKSAFNTRITIKYGADGGFSYFKPYLSVGPSLAGSRTRDENLTIAFTPQPLKAHVNTLPEGAPLGTDRAREITSATPEAAARLDQILQIEAIRNIRRNEY